MNQHLIPRPAEATGLPPDPLRSLRARHPGWQIEVQGPVWVAVRRPTQTALDMAYGHTIEELDGKLRGLS